MTPQLGTFFTPIVDSGYFFEHGVIDLLKVRTPDGVALRIKYRLKNPYSRILQIPIPIAHFAFLNCTQEGDFDKNTRERVYSDRVVNLHEDQVMYGYGDDHHIVFHAGEQKEFLIMFQAAANDFDTFDIEYFMRPIDAVYGLYRLRYDFTRGAFTKRYCIRTYPE